MRLIAAMCLAVSLTSCDKPAKKRAAAAPPPAAPVAPARPDGIAPNGEELVSPVGFELADLDAVVAREREMPALHAAGLRRLRDLAGRAYVAPLRTVMDKPAAGPSGDKHDLLTIARYYWPNPDTEGGLPYVFRDGETNPEIFDARYDKTALVGVFRNVHALALAAYVFDSDAYARRAVDQLRVFFVSPATRVNPRLAHAQGVRGETDGRHEGIVDMAGLVDLIDDLAILLRFPAYTHEISAGMRSWLEEYYGFLASEPRATDAAALPNHLGTWFDAQQAALAAFLGRDDDVKAVIARVKTASIPAQIAPDGRQPLEAPRALARHNEVENVLAYLRLVWIAGKAGDDLWAFETTDGRSIPKAVRYLLTHAVDNPDLGAADLAEPLARAVYLTPGGGFEEFRSRVQDQDALAANVAMILWPQF